MGSILAGITALLNKEYWMYILALYPIFIVVYLLSSYISKIEENEKTIKEMNKKIEIHGRISRLEGKVFK
ncbi:MAG: hypothetical protein Q8L29_01830 [archaeon]|nr:hypothetical protein [archaeon]